MKVTDLVVLLVYQMEYNKNENWDLNSSTFILGSLRSEMVDALSLNIKIQILLTALHVVSYSISWENLLKDQSNFPYIGDRFIHSHLTCSLDYDIVRRNLMLVTLGA